MIPQRASCLRPMWPCSQRYRRRGRQLELCSRIQSQHTFSKLQELGHCRYDLCQVLNMPLEGHVVGFATDHGLCCPELLTAANSILSRANCARHGARNRESTGNTAQGGGSSSSGTPNNRKAASDSTESAGDTAHGGGGSSSEASNTRKASSERDLQSSAYVLT